jgi:hypothetical protein
MNWDDFNTQRAANRQNGVFLPDTTIAAYNQSLAREQEARQRDAANKQKSIYEKTREGVMQNYDDLNLYQKFWNGAFGRGWSREGYAKANGMDRADLDSNELYAPETYKYALNYAGQIGAKGARDLTQGRFINEDSGLVGGVAGAFINPLTQTGTALADLGSGQYGANNRDWLSDLGALGESALMFTPAGLLSKGSKLAKIGKGAAIGAGFGAGGTLRREGLENSNLGNVLGNAAIGAGFGAAIPLGAAGLRNLGGRSIARQKAKLAEVPYDSALRQSVMSQAPARQLYTQAFTSPRNLAAMGGGLAGVLGAGALMWPKAATEEVAAVDGLGGLDNLTDDQLYELYQLLNMYGGY